MYINHCVRLSVMMSFFGLENTQKVLYDKNVCYQKGQLIIYSVRMSVTVRFLESNFEMQICKEKN